MSFRVKNPEISKGDQKTSPAQYAQVHSNALHQKIQTEQERGKDFVS